MLYITRHNSQWEERAREVEVSTSSRLSSRYDSEDASVERENEASGLKGVHLYPVDSCSIHFVFKGTHVFATRSRNLVGDGNFEETLNLSFLTISPATIREFLSAARHAWEVSERGRITVFQIDRYGYWSRSRTITRRLRDSIYLPAGTKERILSDASTFLSDESRIWYGDRGIPYRRGYLFHGKPGSGKTSLAHVLASELERPIYQLTLSGPGISDSKFAELMASVPSGAIVILEDIDCAFATREAAPSAANSNASMRKDLATMDLRQRLAGEVQSDSGTSTPAGQGPSSSVSLSGLLNAIDGISAGEARILIMTTNHRNQLDEALIRPGRVDLQVPFGNATKGQARELFIRWFKPTGATRSQLGGAANVTSRVQQNAHYNESHLGSPVSDASKGEKAGPAGPPTSLSSAAVDDDTGDLEEAADHFAAVTPSDKYSIAALQGFLLACRGQATQPSKVAQLWAEEVNERAESSS